MDFRERLSVAISRTRLTQTELGKALGKGQTAVSNWVREGAEKHNQPDFVDIQKIAEIAGMSPAWIAFEIGLPDETPGESAPEIDARVGAGGGGFRVGEFNAGAKPTEGTSSDQPIGLWHFPEGYLSRELRVRPRAARVVEVKGDSMSPTLESGDRIMVDTSDRTPSPAGIFALWDGLGLVVKRLDHIPNSDPATVKIISDNPRHETYERTAGEVSIIGRVVWYARKL